MTKNLVFFVKKLTKKSRKLLWDNNLQKRKGKLAISYIGEVNSWYGEKIDIQFIYEDDEGTKMELSESK